MKVHFKKLTKPTIDIAQVFNRWGNDISLAPFLRPNKNQEEIEKQHVFNIDELAQRIELGVFEFNTNALKLYQKLGYKEINRTEDFTYWNGKMWHDIRMEKYL